MPASAQTASNEPANWPALLLGCTSATKDVERFHNAHGMDCPRAEHPSESAPRGHPLPTQLTGSQAQGRQQDGVDDAANVVLADQQAARRDLPVGERGEHLSDDCEV